MRYMTVVDERTDKKRPVNEKCANRIPNLAIISLVHPFADGRRYYLQGLHESAMSSDLSTLAYWMQNVNSQPRLLSMRKSAKVLRCEHRLLYLKFCQRLLPFMSH